MARSSVVPVVFVLLLAGCYRYEAARMGAVPSGTRVRVHLSDAGVQRLREVTGRERREVSGELLRWAEDVVLSVPVAPENGAVDRGLQQRLVLPAEHVVAVEVREVDRARTVALVVGLVAGTAAAVITAVTGGGEAPGPQPPDGPREGTRVPVLPPSGR